MNIILRKIAATVKPTLTITKDGDKWVIKSKSTFKNEEDEFTIGIEFDKGIFGRVNLINIKLPISNFYKKSLDSQDGRKVKIMPKVDGDKLIGEQRDRKTGELQVVAIKYVTDEDEMIEVEIILFS